MYPSAKMALVVVVDVDDCPTDGKPEFAHSVLFTGNIVNLSYRGICKRV
jgi:hypothetical protein